LWRSSCCLQNSASAERFYEADGLQEQGRVVCESVRALEGK
jgi:hypothetical protein